MYKLLARYIQVALITMDFVLMIVSYYSSLSVFGHSRDFFQIPSFMRWFFFMSASWVVFSYFFGVYSESIINNFDAFSKRTVQVYLLWAAAQFFYFFLFRESSFSRMFTLAGVAGFAVALFINRFLYFGFRYFARVNNSVSSKVIILGFNNAAKKLADFFEKDGINTHLLGFIEDEKNINELTNYPVLAGYNHAIAVAEELGVQEIFSTIAPEQNKHIYKLIDEAEKKCMRFKVVPDFSIFFSKPVIIDYIRDMPVLSVRSDPMEDIGNRIKKRALDLVVSSLVIIFVLSWMMPLMAILIMLESRGFFLFSQLRSGRNDKPFYCLKFRSMRKNSEPESRQATKNDARVTRLGAFLRKTSLDEFPQFINVFRGDMSLVGPRPHMVKHTSDFSKVVDHYMVRQFLKPGITGWAQVRSFRGEITHPDQLKMRIASDLWYFENWTIWLDIRILFLTVYQVFAGDKNAY